MSSLQTIFNTLKKLLQKNSRGLIAYTTVINSKAKSQKPAYHLYGKKEVQVLNRKPQRTYIAGIIMQKNFVGFYSMPVYSHPKEFAIRHPLLKKFRTGKSCFNISKLDDAMLKELDKIITEGVRLYRKEEWI